MKFKLGLFALLMLLVAALVSCDDFGTDIGKTISGKETNVLHGELLFNQPTMGENAAPGCVTCHSLEEGVVTVGPSQAGMATRAGQAVAGMSAADYLRTSIVEPNATIVDGFAADVMYQNYAADLSANEIDDLVAYLLTLK